MRACVAFLATIAACSDPAPVIVDAPDVPVDQAIDTPMGMCGADRFVTGEILQLDSSNANFAGVNNARFTVQGTSVSDTTAPNGRFELCVAGTGTILLDLDAQTELDGPVYIENEALAGLLLSFRTMPPARATSFYTERGLTFDANRAHILVFLAGDRTPLTLDRAHDTTQAASDDDADGAFTWSANDVGRYVLFPNVATTVANATLTGDLSGPHTVPIAAGRLTLVALYWRFL